MLLLDHELKEKMRSQRRARILKRIVLPLLLVFYFFLCLVMGGE